MKMQVLAYRSSECSVADATSCNAVVLIVVGFTDVGKAPIDFTMFVCVIANSICFVVVAA